MTRLHPQGIAAFAALAALVASSAGASTVSASDPSAAGISYEWSVSIGGTDSAAVTRHVGAFSWNEPANPPGLKGWTHTSDWIALTLTEATVLTIEVARTAGVSTGTAIAGDQLTPAFTLFTGLELVGDEDHQYNNVGNSAWADEIFYLGHEANAAGAATVSKSFSLAAGTYSIAIGGNPLDTNVSGRQGYTATLTTAPIPEPSTALLIGLGLLGLRRRRPHAPERG